jgi:hypothetical protein
MAKSYAQKYFLDLPDDLMKENREWLKKDAALQWELAQIQNMGPNWREQLAAAQSGLGGEESTGAAPAELGGGGGGGSAGGSEIPEFGGSAPVGPAGTEGGEPGAEGGAGGPPAPGAPETDIAGAGAGTTPVPA